MVARLELKLKCREALSYQMASLFHGVLMELLPEEYADELHYSSGNNSINTPWNNEAI